MDKDKLVEIKDSITEDITLGNLKDIARQVKMPGFSKYKSDTKNELVKLLKKFIKNLIKQKTPPSPKPKKGKTSKEKSKIITKKDVEPAEESEYKKRDLIKKSIEELKQILKSQKIKQGYSQADDKTKLIGDFFLSQRCDPEKGKWCPDDQLCDIRNIKGGGPGICRTPELLDEYEGLIQQTVGKHTFVGSQTAIDELNTKLESIKSKDISKKLGELSKKAIKAAQKQAEEDEKASKKQVEEEAKAAKKQAEEEAKAAKKQAEEEAKAAKKQAEEEAKAANKQAEEEAKVAKKQAEEEAKAAKKQSKKQADLKNTLEKMDFIELVEVANELGFNETADGTDISNMEPDQLIDEILYFSLYKEQKPSEEKSSVKTKKDISGLLKTLKKNKDVGEIADIGDVQKEILKCLGLL